MTTGVIYGLHSGDGRVWYIGQTRQPLGARLAQLKSRAKAGTMGNSDLAQKIIASDTIEIVSIQITDSLDDAEATWIGRLKPSFNRQSGGSSGFYLADSSRAKIGVAALAQFARQGNPFEGKTHSAESIAKIRKARQSWGKLSEAEVAEIRENAEGLTQRKLAERYGVSQQHVSDIVTHRRWSS